jgi:hypothetical protein
MTDPEKQLDQIEEALKNDDAELDGTLESGIDRAQRETTRPKPHPDHASDGGVI